MVRNRKRRKVHVEDSWKINIKINGNCVYHRNCGIAGNPGCISTSWVCAAWPDTGMCGIHGLMMILVTQDWQSLLDHDTGEKETRNRYKIFVAIFCLFSLNTLFRF